MYKEKNPKCYKLLAKLVRVNKPENVNVHNKVGVVMDDEYVYRGVIYCRVIIGPEVYNLEYHNLYLIQI